MGVAGLIFEPHPPNFENQYSLRDVQMMLKRFLITLLVSDFQRSVWSVPLIPECPWTMEGKTRYRDDP